MQRVPDDRATSFRRFCAERPLALSADHPIGVLRLDLAKICEESLEIAAELSVELPPRLAGFFNDRGPTVLTDCCLTRSFHDVCFPATAGFPIIDCVNRWIYTPTKVK